MSDMNQTLVRGYLEELLNHGNVATIERFFDCQRLMFNGTRCDAQQLMQLVYTFRNGFPDLHLSIEKQCAEGEVVITRATFRGIHNGVFMGIAPTGKPATWLGIAIDRIEAGKIVEMWHVADFFAVMQQIGACLYRNPSRGFMRLTPDVFQQQPLRVHTFLADVPLHDVWTVRLYGGEGCTLQDFQALCTYDNVQRVNPVVRGLFRLRGLLGVVFGWDHATPQTLTASYIYRLTEMDRKRSLVGPGSVWGPFRVIYAFENEMLYEALNRTVHAFSLMAMVPEAGGFTVYWAIYVKNINWLTPLYMTLIDPFRRFLIYPAMIRNMERAWAAAHGHHRRGPT